MIKQFHTNLKKIESKISTMNESVRTFTDDIAIEVIKTLNSNLLGTMLYDDRVNTLITMATMIPLIKYRINGGAKIIYLHRTIVRVLGSEE